MDAHEHDVDEMHDIPDDHVHFINIMLMDALAAAVGMLSLRRKVMYSLIW